MTSLADALNRFMAEVSAAATADPRPELMRDRDIRAQYFGNCSRTTYWLLTKREDFPRAIEAGPRLRLRHRSEIEAWLAEHKAT